MDQINRYTDPLNLSLLVIVIIGVFLISTGINQVLNAESDDNVLQRAIGVVVGVVTGPLMILAVLLRPLDMLAHSMSGRRARPGEIAYEENKTKEKGPYTGGNRIGIGIVLIILVYFAWDNWLEIIFLWLPYLADMFNPG